MGKNDMLFTMLILIATALFAALGGWRWKVYQRRSLVPIWIYCIIGFLGLTLSTVLAYHSIHNIWLLSILFALDIFLLAFYFYRVSSTLTNHPRQFVASILGVLLIAYLHICLSDFPPEEEYKEFFIAKGYLFASMTILVLIHFYDLIKNAPKKRIDQNPAFLVSAGLLIYAAGSFIPELSTVYGFKMDSKQELLESRIVIFVISNALSLINYLMIILAFRLHYKLQKA